jgi:hypothetical protein
LPARDDEASELGNHGRSQVFEFRFEVREQPPRSLASHTRRSSKMSSGLWMFEAEAQFFSGAVCNDEGVQKGTDLTRTHAR